MYIYAEGEAQVFLIKLQSGHISDVIKVGILHHIQQPEQRGGGHGGTVVTLSPPTSEAGVWFLAQPQVGKLVVACCWLAVYSIEP